MTARTVPLVADEQLDVSSAADVVRPLLSEGDWEAGVLLTDLPRRAGLRPVSVEVSPADRIALVSLLALGSWRMRRRARRIVADVVGMLTRERADLAPLEEAGRLEASGVGEDGLERFIVPGLRGHLSLVTGMVRANRPWRLFATLSRALAGVFATAAFGLINNSTWKISSGMDVGRLIGASVVSLLALTAWIIIDHELWERPHGSLSRSFSRLYNTVTCVTITFGVLSLYVCAAHARGPDARAEVADPGSRYASEHQTRREPSVRRQKGAHDPTDADQTSFPSVAVTGWQTPLSARRSSKRPTSPYLSLPRRAAWASRPAGGRRSTASRAARRSVTMYDQSAGLDSRESQWMELPRGQATRSLVTGTRAGKVQQSCRCAA